MTGKISWNHTLADMNIKLTPATKMRIGPRGGRFVVIDGKDYSLNSLYKMIKHICAKGLSPQEKMAGRHLMETLGKLDEKGSNLKKNKISGEPKTSFIQKRLTELKSMVGKLLFGRSKEVSKLKTALDFVEPQNTSSNTRRGKQPNGNGAVQPRLADDTQSGQEHETHQQQHQSHQTRPAISQPAPRVSLTQSQVQSLNDHEVLSKLNKGELTTEEMKHLLPAQIERIDLSKITDRNVLSRMVTGAFRDRIHLFKGGNLDILLKNDCVNSDNVNAFDKAQIKQGIQCGYGCWNDDSKAVVKKHIQAAFKAQISKFSLTDVNECLDVYGLQPFFKDALKERQKALEPKTSQPNNPPHAAPISSPMSLQPSGPAFIPSPSNLTTSTGNADALSEMLADVPADKIIAWINSGKCKSEDFSLMDLSQTQAEKLLEGFKSINVDQIYESARFLRDILDYCEGNQLQKKFIEALNGLPFSTIRQYLTKKMIDHAVVSRFKRSTLLKLNLTGIDLKVGDKQSPEDLTRIIENIKNRYCHPYLPDIIPIELPKDGEALDYNNLIYTEEVALMTPLQIETGMIHAQNDDTFQAGFMDHLSDEQVAKIDFSKFRRSAKNAFSVFYQIFSDKYHRITPQNINYIAGMIAHHFDQISAESLTALKVNENTGQFWHRYLKSLTPKEKFSYSDISKKKILKSLSSGGAKESLGKVSLTKKANELIKDWDHVQSYFLGEFSSSQGKIWKEVLLELINPTARSQPLGAKSND